MWQQVLEQACCERKVGRGHAESCRRYWRRRVNRALEIVVVCGAAFVIVFGAAWAVGRVYLAR